MFSLHKLAVHTRFALAEAGSLARRAINSDPHSTDLIEAETLEDRILLSASPIAAALAESVDALAAADPSRFSGESETGQVTESEQSAAAEQPGDSLSQVRDQDEAAQGSSFELVFVDTGAKDYQLLVDDLLNSADENRRFEVHLLESSRDGVEQISNILAGYDDIDAVHLVSHGTNGQVKLGNTWLGINNLAGYAGDIAGWDDALHDGADLLIYGCNLAASEDGRALTEALSSLCDCDVAASVDDTGYGALGGDWELEHATGVIDVRVAFSQALQHNWSHVLALETVRDNFGLISYSNNDGSQSWTTPWTEIGESDGPNSSKVQVNDDFGDRGILIKNSDVGAWREVDLSTAVYATLTFDYARESLDDPGDYIDLEVSANGGGSWTLIERFQGPADDPTTLSASYDISSFVANDTRIRFVSGPNSSSGDKFFIDNVQIEYDDTQAPGGIDTNLNLWLRADAGVTTTGGKVSQWDNQVTASALTDVSASGGARPTFNASTLNFNPVISFDGNNDHLSATSVLASTLFSSNASSIYTVTSLNNTGDVILQWEDNVLGTANRVNVEDELRFDFGHFVNDQYATASPSAGYHILNAVAAPNTPVSLSFNIDGQQTTSGNASGNNPLVLGNTGDFFLGEYPGGGFNEDIDLGEVIIFSSDLTAAEQTRVDTYLAVKYGITIDQTAASNYVDSQGNVIWNATTNSSYNNDIAGIGRDLTSTLDQSQSKSINSDAIVTMDAASDQHNREFLIWGNDDGALVEVTGEPSIIASRLDRIWRVDETGDVGTTTIEFDLTGLTYTGSTDADFRLIVDTDADFSSGASTIAATSYNAGSKIVTFTGINLDDAAFFALGTEVASNSPPMATNLTQNQVYIEGAASVALADIVVTDGDAGDSITARLTLNNPLTGSLTTGTFGLVTSTYNSGTGIWEAIGNVTDVNAALADVAFEPTINNDIDTNITTHIEDAEPSGPADGTITLDVTPVNDVPTLTAFSADVETTNEDTEVEVTLAELKTQGDENDIDGTVDAFVVKSVTTGSLKIGASAGTATPWIAVTNDTIDATNHAYWTPDLDVNSTQNAFEVVAQDNNGAESVGNVMATIGVTAVNDIPVISATGASTINAGNLYTLNLSVTDPDNDPITSWTVNWGDGTIETFAGNPSSVTHTYTNAGFTNNILVSMTDATGTYFQNELLVASSKSDSLMKYGTDGGFLFEFGLPPDPETPNYPVDAIIGPDGNLYVSAWNSHDVLRYNPSTGAFIDEFVTAGSGGLNSAAGLAFGPDGNLYVASRLSGEVLRFQGPGGGTPGQFIDVFADANPIAAGTEQPEGLVFGPDGDLYVSDFNLNAVYRFDGTTGAPVLTAGHPLGEFVAPGSGGLDAGEDLVFGPDGNLYVASDNSHNVLRYNGTTGAFMDEFVAASAGGLQFAQGLSFGPDGNFYVGSWGSDSVLRYQGLAGASPGDYIDNYVGTGSGGLEETTYFSFLPLQQVTVTSTNNPPTLTSFSGVIDTTNEDIEVEVTLAELKTQGDENDVDGTVDGFVVKSVASGTLKIGPNAGSATAWAAGSNDTIDAANKAYWTPDPNVSGTQNAFEVVAEDNSGAESATNVMATIGVTAVNDAPVLADAIVLLNSVGQDVGAPGVGAGTRISELIDFAGGGGLDNVSDVDDVVTGIAIVGADTSNGTWLYSTNDGNNWFALGAVDTENARLLAADTNTRLYFQPNAGYSGVISSAITFHAWDQTLGANGGLGDTTPNGSSTPYSSASDTAQIIVEGILDEKAEFVGSTTPGFDQRTRMQDRGSHRSVGIADTGDYVVVWSSNGQDGSGWGVYAQRFDKYGNAVGLEIPVTQTTGDDQSWSTVAVDKEGNFVVAWTSKGQDEGSTRGVYARMFYANGTPVDNEFLVNTVTAGDQKNPSIDMDGAGNFIIAWEGNGPGDSDGVFARRFYADGTDIDATEFLVNTDLSRSHSEVAVSMNDSGEFLVTWDNSQGFIGRLYDAGGTPQPSEIVIEADSTAGNGSAVMRDDGTFVAVWREGSTFDREVKAQRFSASGTPVGAQIDVNTSTSNNQTDPSITADDNGAFIIVWEGNGDQSGNVDSSGVFGQKFDASGNPVGSEFLINETTSNAQDRVSVAMHDLNHFVAVWTGSDGAQTDVFIRQYGENSNTPPTLTSFAADVESTNEDIEVEVTLAELKTQGDENDIDGTVDAFVVKTVASGTLKIGTSSGTAAAWAAGSNDTIDAANKAYWTPDPDVSGTQNAFEVVAEDNQGAESATNVMTTIGVTAVNDIPTLTSFAADVESTNEDIEVEVTLAELKTQGDENDIDGTVDAFVVKAVASGTLKIGTNAGSATAWAASTNDTIDAANNAYWTPDPDVSGTQNAFEVVAEDNQGAESATNVMTTIGVTAVNDIPTLTAFAAVIDITPLNTEVELTLTDLKTQGDEADVDGTVDAFVVKSISSGTLKIGTSSGTAAVWAAGSNDTIDAANNAYWTPDLAATGVQNAFEVVAQDNLAAESVGNVTAQVNVTANIRPTLTTFAGSIDSTNEDTEVEITFTELATLGDENDPDGTVDAFVVKSLPTGSLKIGSSAAAATPWAAGTNDTIDATNNAYWTPDLNVFGGQSALDVVAEDNDGDESMGTVTAMIDVNPVNDIPTLTSFAAVIDTTALDTEVELTLTELKTQGDEADVDGTVDAFVVRSISSGTLKIGTSAGSATPWAAGSNDTINATNNAYWTPDLAVTGIQNAFEVVAQDNLAAESVGNVTAQVNVSANTPPTLTAFVAPVDATSEDIEVEVTLADLKTQGDEADVDGTVDGFVVKAISSGTLKIGTSSGTATPWAAGSNDTINATNNAYWTPDPDVSGTLNALEVVALDNNSAESLTNVTAQISVTAVNDIPTLTTFASVIDTTAQDTEVEVTLADLKTQGDEADVDGTVDGFVVKAISSGSLKIGTSSGSATPWAAGSNDTIDAANNAYWTPDLATTGLQNAFEVVAQDNLAAESVGNITAQVNVSANTPPTLTLFAAAVDVTNEDTEVEITFTELAAQGNENDADGTVDGFVVKSLASGSLRIGTSSGTAAAWAAGSNDTIDATNNAYWTPDPNSNGAQSAFAVVAQDDLGAESAGSVTANITVNPVNDAPNWTGNGLLAGILQDDFNPPGNTISNIFAGQFNDVDSGSSFDGIALISNTANAGTEGVWQYSTDNGTTWLDVGSVADNPTALALDASDRLRFVPVAGYSGTITPLVARALDNTYSGSYTNGATRATVDASINGGATAISANTANIHSLVAVALNNAPILNPALTPVLDAVNEDAGLPSLGDGTLISTLVDLNSPAGGLDNVTDADLAPLTGIAVTAADTTHGTWLYSIDGGASWNSLGAVNNNSARLLAGDANTRIYFQANPDFHGTVFGAITFRAWDQTSGANGGLADTTPPGGSSPFSTAQDTADITVNPVNDIPTLASFTGVIDTTALDTQVEITLAELKAQGDEADIDGTVDAFVVQSLATGSLKLGASAATATPWAAGTNDTINATIHAYWTPDLAASGILNAFQVLAQDNLSAESIGNVMAQVSVAANAPPTLISFANSVETVDEDTEVEITFAELAAQGDEHDTDGSVVAFTVKTVASGSLRIGSDDASATPWDPGLNDKIDGTTHAYWTPDLNANGTQDAFELVAVDDLGAESIGPVTAQVDVTDVNDPPTLTSLAAVVETTDEDTEVEITFAELAAQGDEHDTDGSVVAFTVKAVHAGTLKIGASSATATPWQAGVNDTIDGTTNAYWAADPNTHGTQSAFDVVAVDDLGAESIGPVTVRVEVNSVNDPPVAVGESYEVDATYSLTVTADGVLANDTDPEGSPLHAVLVAGPANGALALNSDGSFTYTPSDGFSGNDSFSYGANDGDATSDPVTVTIVVNAIAGPAVAGPPTTGPASSPAPTTSDPGAESPAESEPPPAEEPLLAEPPRQPDKDPIDEAPAPPPAETRPRLEPILVTLEAEPSVLMLDPAQQLARRGGSDEATQREQQQDASSQTAIANLSFQTEVGSLWHDLDQLGNQIDATSEIPDIVIGSAAGLTSSISVGYVVWLIRGGHVMAGLMAQLPAWRLIDPLPILGELNPHQDDDDDDDSLQSIVESNCDENETLEEQKDEREASSSSAIDSCTHD